MSYQERNKILFGIGFKDYDEYLKSDLWAEIRFKQLKAMPDCLMCGETATQVHHLKYTEENLKGINAKCLSSICRRCHNKIEFSSGSKVTLESANKNLLRGDRRTHFKDIKTIGRKSSKGNRTHYKFKKCQNCKTNTAKRRGIYCTPCQNLIDKDLNAEVQFQKKHYPEGWTPWGE